MLRAELLLQLDRVDDAVESAMWIPKYLDNPETVNSLAQLLVFTNLLATNSELLDSVGPPPAFLSGLLDLRRGAYADAVSALTTAELQPDDARLYYGALALLSQGVTGRSAADLAAAQSLMRTLLSEHPDSRYVASVSLVLRAFPRN